MTATCLFNCVDLDSVCTSRVRQVKETRKNLTSSSTCLANETASITKNKGRAERKEDKLKKLIQTALLRRLSDTIVFAEKDEGARQCTNIHESNMEGTRKWAARAYYDGGKCASITKNTKEHETMEEQMEVAVRRTFRLRIIIVTISYFHPSTST